ncbi:integrase core domain-containing protein [Flexibacterium corallicola]
MKYEEVYLKTYNNVDEARKFIRTYIAFFNQTRPHPSLDAPSPRSGL